MMVNANDTNENLYSKDILLKLYHQALQYSFTVYVCRNGITYIILRPEPSLP